MKTKNNHELTDEQKLYEIHFLKGYAVFNVEQIERLPRSTPRRPHPA